MSSRAIDVAVAAVAARQAGVVVRQQVLAAGGTDRQISYRLRTGVWRQIRPGIYLLAGLPPHRDRDRWAASLAAGPVSLISHEAAARMHRLEGCARASLVLAVPPGHHTRVPGVRVHQLGDIAANHYGTMRWLRVTTVARTLVDMSTTAHPRVLERAFDDAIAKRRVTEARVADVLPDAPGLPAGSRSRGRWVGDRAVSVGDGGGRPPPSRGTGARCGGRPPAPASPWCRRSAVARARGCLNLSFRRQAPTGGPGGQGSAGGPARGCGVTPSNDTGVATIGP